MIELVLAADDFITLKAELIGGDTEKCAVLYANQMIRADGVVRLLVRESQFPAAADYTKKELLEAELKPEFVARVTKRARRDACAVVFVHSHPGSEAPRFSHIDLNGEKHLATFLATRHPALTHASVVISAAGIRARRLGGGEDIRVISIGTEREVLFDPLSPSSMISEKFDRQLRAFGSDGQKALQCLRIAIVGLGGTGSLIAQQLVHLGVRNFILIDPDILESTNLNRVANATPDDIGKPKIEIAAQYIHAIAQDANVACINGDVIQARTARELLNADLIFGCTDSHGSRAVLQQISYQYMIPCIDMGVTITVKNGIITHIYGRVQLLSPGLACFTCGGLLNPNEVRHDMMTAFERQADPYIQGEREPAPAVMSLNSTAASLAITMMLAIVTKVPMGARHVLYNAMSSSLRAVRGQPQPNCYICSRSGSLARGNTWPLFAREA